MDVNTELLVALARAKAGFGPLQKKGVNRFLQGAKYVLLDDLLDAVGPALAEQDLLVLHTTAPGVPVRIQAQGVDNKGQPWVRDETWPAVKMTTTLLHAPTGASLEVTATAPYGDDRGISGVQSLGKVVTYLRRYTITMLVGIATEEDDDAQPVTGTAQTPNRNQAPAPAQVDAWGASWLSLFGGDKSAARARLDAVLAGRRLADLTPDEKASLLADEQRRVAKIEEEKLAASLAAAATTG